VPDELVTVTATVPDPAGLTAVTDVSEFTVKVVAGTDPKSTFVAPVKFAPEIVTEVPPEVAPAAGLTESTAGLATYVYWSAGDVADVPPASVTVMSTVAFEPDGLTAMISVGDT
jgi:hypothetical protein